MIKPEELLAFVEAGKHSSFEYIRNWESFKVARIIAKQNRRLVKAFRQDAKQLYLEYLKQIKSGYFNIQQLVAHRVMLNAADFFVREAEIVEGMMAEYSLYLSGGNLIKSLMGYNRTDEDLINLEGDEWKL